MNFDNKKIKKSDFCKNKKITSIDDVDVNQILVSKKESYGTKNLFKFVIGYNDDDDIRPLCVKLPQMTVFARKFDENATISFRANNKQVLKNYNKILKIVEKLMRISDCNWTRTQNHLVLKRTLNHLAKLAK